MPQQQHRYTIPATVTQNVGRVERITLIPGNRFVEITYAIGEQTDGTFAKSDRSVRSVPYVDLPPAVQEVFDDLELKALAYAVNIGIFPTGSVEPVPV